MSDEDMIILIKAFESVSKLNDIIKSITGGYGIDAEGLDSIFDIFEVIRNNSRYAGLDEDEDYETFRAILYAINISTEEKYALIKKM